MNRVIIKGNLTRDPEVRDVSGSQVCNFGVAVNRYYKKKDGTNDQETTFLDCEAWDKGAELIAKLLHKGDPVLLEGSLKVENWESDGQKRSRTKIRVSNFEKLFRSPEGPKSGTAASSEHYDAEPVACDGENIPF